MAFLPHRIALLLATLVSLARVALAAEPTPAEQRAFFENKIRPALVKHCYECHSAGAKELGGRLRLDTKAGWQTGGESGPAILPGKPAESPLVQALRYDGLEMPPQAPLPPGLVEDFVRWIADGAFDPRTEEPAAPTAAAAASSATAGKADALWSLAPVSDPPLPSVRATDWPREPLDHFILARIEETGAAPASDADPRTLAIRLHHDLIGLPPTFAELESFVAEHARHGHAATERLVDRLLAKPQFGERWGRHWLDVARYGESNGNDGLGRNPTFPHAWRYRDYVIEAFNADRPYDQFLREQIAGDLLPFDSPEERDRQHVATAFLALGSKPAKAMNTNFDMDVVADQLDVVGRGLLGLSVGCARCHDHKFDPIPTRDYYALAGIFTSTDSLWGAAGHEPLSAPATELHVLQAAPHVPPPADFVETVLVLDSNTGKPRPPPKPKWPVGTPLAMGVRDRPKPADAKINIKGEANKLGEVVPRGFLSAIALPDGAAIDDKQSGRVQLADWLVHTDHPLTRRVLVNRVWGQLFGEGIVATPDDFGQYGERPSHPLLLDHLASRFRAEGWSIKGLIRTIVLSRTYQLASLADEPLVAANEQHRLFAHQRRRRLDAESLRDKFLHASGQLDLAPASGSLMRHRDILVNRAGNLHEPTRHRSVYLCYLRSSPPPDLAPFDLPDFFTSVAERQSNTVAPQALYLFNNPLVIEQSRRLAESVRSEAEAEPARIAAAWRRAFCRDPRPGEFHQASELLRALAIEGAAEDESWLTLCQALLIANEFRYID